jgi:hypothetical protein
MLAVIPFMLGIQMLLVALQLDIQESPKLPTLPPLRPHATPDPQLPAAGGGAQDLGTRGAVTRGRGAATEPLTNEVEGA